jgi:cytoskeletal protein RodZ
MSEMSELLNGLRRSDPGDSPHSSVGDTLKSLREAKGLTLPDVSARIKYSALQLGYLESCDWGRLPEGVPLRGLVRNYARFLEADVDAVLRLLDDAVGSTRPRPTVTALGARRALQQADLKPAGEPAHRTWAWLVLILVLFCVVGLYAINRGWVPDQWLIFDWLKALRP